ncbi:hypothetical protein ASC62_09040 [Caulobacter sp. Root342]|nr:hypothetical protein ASC62_09040 [Caulobacter sp. Root342]
MIAEQRDSRVLDDRQVTVAVVADDVDRDPRHVFGTGAGRREGSPEIGEHLARLSRQITGADELPVPDPPRR